MKTFLLLFVSVTTDQFIEFFKWIGGVSLGVFAGMKTQKIMNKKAQKETESLNISDKIIINKYNKEAYEELLKAFEELEKKFVELKKEFQRVEIEKDEIQRKFNVFKNMRTEE